MRVYGGTFSPYVRKTMAFGAEKGLTLENEMVAPHQKHEVFTPASPFGKIPGFADGDFRISDSTAIINYLDAKFSEPNLIPTEAKARGKTWWYDEYADTILVIAANKLFFHRVFATKFLGREADESAAQAVETDELPPILDYLESVLPASGHLVEDRITLADLAVASPFANLIHLGFDLGRWPKSKAFAEAILARPSFAPLIANEKAILTSKG